MANKLCALAAFAVLILSQGCAMKPVNVKMADADPTASTSTFNVVDDRLVKDLEIVYTAFNSSNTTVPIALDPDIAAAIKQQVIVNKTPSAPTVINLERAEFRNRVGFGTTDKMSCALQSSVAVAPAPPRQVRTVLTDIGNDSSLVFTGARLLIQTCLARHGKDLAAAL